MVLTAAKIVARTKKIAIEEELENDMTITVT